MRTFRVVHAAAVMGLLPAVCLAHSFQAPASVRALADGSFSYRVVFYADPSAEIATSRWNGLVNCSQSFIGSAFCLEVAAGDSVEDLVQGSLNDPNLPGRVRSRMTLCPDGASYADTTEILPYSHVSVQDPPVAALRLWNQPNPVMGRTTFHFTLPRPGRAVLKIYDMAGRLLAAPLDGTRDAGSHSFDWNAAGASGAKLAPGVYIARIDVGDHSATRRFVITK